MKHDKRTRTRGRRFGAPIRLLAAFALLSGAFGIFSSPSGATTISSTFELDGNPEESGTTGVDWEALMNGAGGSIAKTDVPVHDGADPEGGDTTYWKGGGSKDVNDVNQWAYSGTDVAPDKNEIVNAAAAAFRVPDQQGGDADSDDDLVIAFHADRFSNDGDAAAGFWFFKNPVELNGGKFTAPGGGAYMHAIGDTFVVSDFNEGEGINTIRVFTWTNSGLTEAPIPGGNAPKDCQEDNHNVFVCATENRTDQDDLEALWDYDPKANVGIAGHYPDFTFLEGAINISAVLPGADQCFASFLAETRSSTSPTAQLKDFVLGDFPICAPSTSLSASPTVASPEIAVVGDDVTFSFTETNDGNVPLTNVYVDTDNAACDAAMTPAPLATLAGGGASQVFSCTITTGNTPAIIDIVGTGHGTDPLGRDVTFCSTGTSSSTVFCDAQEQATARAVTILPGTDLTVTSVSPSTVKTGDEVTFTITEENDGVAPTGFNGSLDLTSVTVTASSLDAPSATVDECNEDLASPTSGDTGDDGVLSFGEVWTYQCTVTAPSNSFTLTFNGSGVALAGTTHEVTVDADFDAEEEAGDDVTIIQPSTELTITADVVITYTFVEKNDGDAPLTPPTPGDKTSVLSFETGAVCDESDPVFVSSDVDTDDILEPQESWTFTCEGTLDGPTGDTGETSSTLTANGHGEDETGDDVTYPDDEHERDRVTVTIENHQRGSDPAP